MRYLLRPRVPFQPIDMVVLVVSLVVAWFAAVGIQGYAYSLRHEHETLVQSGAVPHGGGPPFGALYALSIVVGFALPLLAVAGRRWLAAGRRLPEPTSAVRDHGRRSPAPPPKGKKHTQLQQPQPAPTPRADLAAAIEVGARQASTLICPFCRGEDAEDLVRCPSCATEQHSECLAAHDRCAVCGQREDFERVRARG